MYSSKMITTSARCFAFVGPYLPLNSHFAVGNFIRDGLMAHTIEVKGDGTPYRSYLYAADLVIWLWTILLRGKTGLAYNLGSEQAINIDELAHTIARLFNPVPHVYIHHKQVAGNLAERYIPSTRLASETLGLDAWIALPEALRRTIQWYGSRL
jgi:dTDP-glucose 4,6-dehydratase